MAAVSREDPGRAASTAPTRSPRSGSGTPSTTAVPTSGKASSASSTSRGATLEPEVLIISESRPSKNRQPSAT